jgi:hypothetical protein
MPPIKSINFDDGLTIIGTMGTFSETRIEFGGRIAGLAGNLAKKEERLNKWLNLQWPFATVRPLSDFPADDPIQLGTSTGGEIVDGDDVIIHHFYVAVHIFNANPLSITVMTSNSPIGGDWWL